VINSTNDPAASEQEATKDKFLDRVGIGSGSVEHGDAQFGHSSHRDVVGSSSTSAILVRKTACWPSVSNLPGNGSDSVSHIFLLQFVGTQQNRVGILSILVLATDVIVFTQSVQSHRAQLVVGLDLKLAGSVVVQISVRFPLSAAVLNLHIRKGASCDVGETGSRTKEAARLEHDDADWTLKKWHHPSRASERASHKLTRGSTHQKAFAKRFGDHESCHCCSSFASS